MEKTNIKIMEIKNNNINKNANEQVISSLATELAKVQLLEVSNIIDECETFENIYNKLGGSNLDVSASFMKDELIYVGLQFEYNYKNVNGTIFYDIKSQTYEIYQTAYVRINTFPNPVLYIENIYELIDFEKVV